jgi:hypothetical protein
VLIENSRKECWVGWPYKSIIGRWSNMHNSNWRNQGGGYFSIGHWKEPKRIGIHSKQ